MVTAPNNYDHFLANHAHDAISDEFSVPITISHGLCVPLDPPGSYFTENLAHYDGVLLSVHFSDESKHLIEGSAVMVAPGIAIAAAHVIEPRLVSIMNGSLAIFCVGLTRSGGRMWKVQNIQMASNADLCILSLQYASSEAVGTTFNHATITTRLPRLGELVMIAGFRATEMVFQVEQSYSGYKADVLIGVGKVTERYPNGRDSVILPNPALEIACGARGGMSGGPAFDQHGKLLGILTSSFDSEDDSGPSYVSLLWPILDETITPVWIASVVGGPTSLLRMSRKFCSIDRPETIKRVTVLSTGETTLEIAVWEE